MKNQLILAFTLAAATFVGCKKDSANDPGNIVNNGGNNNGGNDNGGKIKLLNKVTEVEEGETSVWLLDYDSKNRLTSYRKEGGSEANTFTYDGNGNLTQIEFADEEEKNLYKVNYNPKGEPTTGSWEYTENGKLESAADLVYRVENGVVSEIQMLNDGAEIMKSLISYKNGNVSELKMESQGKVLQSISMTYGNKKSVFAGTPLKYLVDIGFSILFYSKNDMTKQSFNFGDVSGKETETSYTYDADGYPTGATSKVIDLPSGDITSTSTVKFEYK